MAEIITKPISKEMLSTIQKYKKLMWMSITIIDVSCFAKISALILLISCSKTRELSYLIGSLVPGEIYKGIHEGQVVGVISGGVLIWTFFQRASFSGRIS